MSKKEIFWGIIIVILILLAYILPYTVLRDVSYWYGSFLLWVVLALLIIGINFIISRDWRG